MKWASSISEDPSLEVAVEQCAAQVTSELAPEPADLLMAFVSSQYQGEYEKVPELLTSHMEVQHLTGCSGGGVIGGGKEVENRPGFALTGAHLPGVELKNFHIENDALPSLDDEPRAWEEAGPSIG